jgi:hypothetical protein
MKKKLTVEFECPEGFDGQWDTPNGEYQVFHDVIICGLHADMMDRATQIAELKKSISAKRMMLLDEEDVIIIDQIKSDIQSDIMEIDYLSNYIFIMKSLKAV